MELTLLVLNFSLLVHLTFSSQWNYLALRLSLFHETTNRNISFFNKTQFNRTSASSKGYVMCAGNKMIPDLVRAVYELRAVWRSYLPIAVMHCDEVKHENMNILHYLNPVRFINICPKDHAHILGIPRSSAVKRLRGFFCKIAALILSPFEHSMFMDLDTVWFKQPEKLFVSRLYEKTGALFFRDRTLHKSLYDDHGAMTDDTKFIMHLFNISGISLSQEYVEQQYQSHGISMWWRCVRPYWNESFRFPSCVGDYQESSVILLNKSKHPKFIETLTKFLPIFDFGYGDKEMFWISATISGEDFTFEPFFAGQYGDCSGFVLHYDPDEYDKLMSEVTPLYINAEYLIEHTGKMTTVGQFIARSITAPQLVTIETKFPPHNNCYRMPYMHKNCTCGDYPCISTPYDVNLFVLRSQWLALSIRLAYKNIEEGFCIPVFVSVLPQIIDIFTHPSQNIDKSHCFMMGCPYFPIKTFTNKTEWLPSIGRICDPVHFSNSTDENFAKLATDYRRPRPPWNSPAFAENQLIQCGVRASLYLLGKDRRFHQFPNWQTFVAMGFDTSNVKQILVEECDSLDFGPLLPEKQ